MIHKLNNKLAPKEWEGVLVILRLICIINYVHSMWASLLFSLCIIILFYLFIDLYM